MYSRILLFAAALVVFLAGCESPEPTPPETTAPASAPLAAREGSGLAMPAAGALLREPVPVALAETPSEALPTWRQHAGDRPTLVLFANHPFLGDLPPALSAEAVRLVREGTLPELVEKASRPRPAPVFFPQMAVAAALEAGLVAEVVWVVPVDGSLETIDLAAFREQFRQVSGATADELAALERTATAISGTVHGHPLRVVTLTQLPALATPVLVHLDLGYFAPLYRHEIGTPIYPLVFRVLKAIQEAGWKARAVTISTSNLAGGLPLETRFLGGDLATLFARPEQLEQPIPDNWSRRADILYLENFFQKDEILARYQAMEREAPADPSIKYGLYQIERQRQQGDQALAYLEEAVALDPVYGLAYLELAEVARDRSRPDAALEMLDQAIAVFPANPFIALRKAEMLVELGHGDQAGPLIAALKALPWSPIYFGGMTDRLDHLLAEATPSQAERYDAYGR